MTPAMAESLLPLPGPSRGGGLRLALIGLAAVAYGNATAAFLGAQPPLSWVAELGPLLLVPLVLVLARSEGLGWRALGLSLRGAPRGLAWGVGAGLLMAAPALAFFYFPVVVTSPVQYAGYRGLEGWGLLVLVFLRLPIRTVLVEELFFRGWLQVRAVQLFGAHRGIAFVTGLFILWHGVVTFHAISLTNLEAAVLPIPMLWALAALPLAAAGLVFSWLRLHTGGLAAPMAAHWTVNSCMALFLAAAPGTER